MDKYSLNFSAETREEYKRRLINQLWKLIPMRENDEDWNEHLKVITEELVGLVRLYSKNKTGLTLVSKLEGLQVCDEFMLYRKTVFTCIDLVGQVLRDD